MMIIFNYPTLTLKDRLVLLNQGGGNLRGNIMEIESPASDVYLLTVDTGQFNLTSLEQLHRQMGWFTGVACGWMGT